MNLPTSHGWCAEHWLDVQDLIAAAPVGKKCLAEDCEQRSVGHKMCRLHLSRVRRWGGLVKPAQTHGPHNCAVCENLTWLLDSGVRDVDNLAYRSLGRDAPGARDRTHLYGHLKRNKMYTLHGRLMQIVGMPDSTGG